MASAPAGQRASVHCKPCTTGVHVVDAIVYGKVGQNLYLRRKLIEIDDNLMAKAEPGRGSYEAHRGDRARPLRPRCGGGTAEAKPFTALLTEAVKAAQVTAAVDAA